MRAIGENLQKSKSNTSQNLLKKTRQEEINRDSCGIFSRTVGVRVLPTRHDQLRRLSSLITIKRRSQWPHHCYPLAAAAPRAGASGAAACGSEAVGSLARMPRWGGFRDETQ
jgi:hypothetical protein